MKLATRCLGCWILNDKLYPDLWRSELPGPLCHHVRYRPAGLETSHQGHHEDNNPWQHHPPPSPPSTCPGAGGDNLRPPWLLQWRGAGQLQHVHHHHYSTQKRWEAIRGQSWVLLLGDKKNKFYSLEMFKLESSVSSSSSAAEEDSVPLLDDVV